MKKKIYLFLIIFSIATIFTFPNFVMAHGMDGYCTLSNGFKETIEHFFVDGRPFSALLFWFFEITKLPFDSISFISAFFTNLFLSLSILFIFLKFENRVENNLKKFSLLFIIFTIFYMPLITEVIMFDEAMIMSLGIFLITIASFYIYKDNLKSYIFALIFCILGVMCYQGVSCFLISLVILFGIVSFEKYDKDELIKFIRTILIAIIIYGLSYFVDYGVMKFASDILNTNTEKLGIINFANNIKLIITDFIPNSFKNLFGFINTNYYYLLFGIILVCMFIWIYKSENRVFNFLVMLCLFLSVLITPFIPNLVMGESNYVAARSVLVITSLPSFVLFVLCLKCDINYFKFIIFVLSILLICFYGLFLFKNCRIDLERYKQDTKYISDVYSYIEFYEKENDILVKTIYYAYDTDSPYYYSTGYNNGVNIRVTSADWGMACGFDAYNLLSHDIVIKPMSDEKYKELYDNKNYNQFIAKDQLVFEKDNLYLLIY